MGTNYYIHCPNTDPAQEGETLHIGKSSMGWVFSLRVHPDRGIRTLYDWMPTLLDYKNTIVDEYGRNCNLIDLLRTITVRSRDEPVQWSDTDWTMNSAVQGPNNLVRGREHAQRTHGEGTWDYCNYEFF